MEYGHNPLNTQPGGDPFQIEDVNATGQTSHNAQGPNSETGENSGETLGKRGRMAIEATIFNENGRLTEYALNEAKRAEQNDLASFSDEISELREQGYDNPGGRKAD